MNQGHTSLAPYVNSADDLYELLQAGHIIQEGKSVRWAWGMLLAAVVGLAFPGAFGKLGWMACIYAGMNWLAVIVDYAGRGWFMHMLSLRHYLGATEPRDECLAADGVAPTVENVGDATSTVH